MLRFEYTQPISQWRCKLIKQLKSPNYFDPGNSGQQTKMCQKLRGICCGASGTWTESTLNNRGKESYRQIKTPPTYLQYLTPFCTLPPSDAYFSALYKTIQLGHFWQIAWSYLWKNNLSLGWNVPDRGGGEIRYWREFHYLCSTLALSIKVLVLCPTRTCTA